MKKLITTLIVILSVHSHFSHADTVDTIDVTGTRDTSGSNSSTGSTSTGNVGLMPTGEAAAKAQARELCMNTVAEQVGNKCRTQATTQRDADLKACDNQAKYGGVGAFGGGAGIAVAFALGSTPVGWIVGAVSLAGGGAGAWFGAAGATSCPRAAQNAYDENIGTFCPQNVKKVQASFCTM